MSPQVSTETEKEKKYRVVIFILIGIIASMLVSIAFFFFTNRNANFDLANSKKKNETLTQKATKYEREAKAIGKQLVAFDIVANKTKKALNEALKHALFISDSSELNLEFEDLCKKLKSDKAEFEKTIGKLDNISAKDFENQLGDYEEKIINISKKFDIFNKKIIVLFKEKSEKDAKIKMDFIYLNAAFEKLQDENTKLKNDLANALSSINENKDKTDWKEKYLTMEKEYNENKEELKKLQTEYEELKNKKPPILDLRASHKWFRINYNKQLFNIEVILNRSLQSNEIASIYHRIKLEKDGKDVMLVADAKPDLMLIYRDDKIYRYIFRKKSIGVNIRSNDYKVYIDGLPGADIPKSYEDIYKNINDVN